MPPAPFRARARAAWTRLRGGELTPARAAASVALGLAIGVTPLWGAHAVLVLLVCVPLRLDAAVAYLAANISLPFIAPFLTMAELEIGSFLLTGAPLPASLDLVRARGPALFMRQLALGTVVFSPAVALLGGSLTYAIARLAKGRARASDPDPAALAVARVAARYAAAGSGPAYHYVRAKLAGDPVARRVADLAARGSLGRVLDAGCGRGQLGLLLLEQGLATAVVGFDWDAKKVAVAAKAAAAPPSLAASYRVGDLRDATVDEADTALLVDVLHYLPDAEQDAALRAIARKARTRVVVRELDPDRGWRSLVTRAAEGVTTTARYNRGAAMNVRPVASLVRALEDEGFAVLVSPCWGATPFSNVLLVGTRVATHPGA